LEYFDRIGFNLQIYPRCGYMIYMADKGQYDYEAKLPIRIISTSSDSICNRLTIFDDCWYNKVGEI
jgi:hypothetical protein